MTRAAGVGASSRACVQDDFLQGRKYGGNVKRRGGGGAVRAVRGGGAGRCWRRVLRLLSWRGPQRVARLPEGGAAVRADAVPLHALRGNAR